MIDKAKRKTLKVLSVAAGSAATAGSAVAAGFTSASGEVEKVTDDPLLAEIGVSTRVSALHNDIEIVLTNRGSDRTTITQMTPSMTRVARGEFNFQSLLKDGPLTLEAGESVSVPLTRKAVKLWSAASNGTTTPLSANLKKTMSIVTDGSAYARVDIADFMAVA